MAAAVVGTVSFLVLIEKSVGSGQDRFFQVLLAASLALPILTGIAILLEKRAWAGPKAWAATAFGVALPVGYFISIFGEAELESASIFIRYFGLSLTAHLLVAFLPYADSASSVEDFWEYNKRLFGNFMVGAFYTLVLFAGLSLAILAVDELFGLHLSGNIYGHLFGLLAGIFNTAYFLANFPGQYEFQAQDGQGEGLPSGVSPYTTAFKNLSKFILIPIVAIYFLILYAYALKIVVTWNLPEGWVGSLVLGFSIAGIFTYLLNYLLVNYDAAQLVHRYRKWFFYVLLPMVVLLFVAIGRRISDYGVTEKRFIVATAGVWLLLLSLYFIVSKKDNIKFIPISLSVFALLTVLGPFNAFRVSERSQVARLMGLLEKNGMLENGAVVPVKDSIQQADARNISDILYYLREHGHIEKVAPLFGVPADSLSEWGQVNDMEKRLNLINFPNRSCYARFEWLEAFDVRGYDKMYRFNGYPQPDSLQTARAGIRICRSQKALCYFEQGELVDSFDLSGYLDTLYRKHQCGAGVQEFTEADATAEIVGQAYQVKLVVKDLEYQHNEVGNTLERLDCDLLLRKKG